MYVVVYAGPIVADNIMDLAESGSRPCILAVSAAVARSRVHRRGFGVRRVAVRRTYYLPMGMGVSMGVSMCVYVYM